MRRIILLLVLCVCAAGAFAYNESVAAISFNPSRLGAYTKLKAVETAKLEGGVMVDGSAYMNLQTNDEEIKLLDTIVAHECASGDGKCVKYDKGTGSGNLNVINTIRPDSGATKTSFDGTGIIQKSSTSPVTSFSISGSSLPVGSTNGTNISISGGTLDATEDSYIDSFAQNDHDQLKELTIGTTEALIENLKAKNDFTVTENFTFGKIKVTPDTCEGGCKGYTFITRVDDGGTEHNILAVQVKN